MDKRDKTLICVAGCGKAFLFLWTEQDFFARRELKEPKRCPPCRQLKREANDDRNANKPLRDAMEKAGISLSYNAKVL